jgi:hypothetical protein
MAKLHWMLQNRFAHYGRHGLGMLGYDPREDIMLNHQQVFDFSEDSNTELIRSLEDELPRRLHTMAGDGVRFWDFFDGICNETPATSEQLRSVLRNLSIEKQVEILDPDARLRGAGVQIRNNDRIRVPRQLTLDIGKA